MNRHTTFLELAAVGLDFRLTSAEQSRLDGHLTSCPTCRARVEGFHRDARAIAGLPEARLDPRRAATVLDVALHGPARSPLPVLRLALVVALVGALVIGTALVGAELLRRMTDDDLSVIPPVPTASPGPEASPGIDNGVGTSWTRVELPDASVPEPGGATVVGVIAGGPGAIAWGWAYGLEPRIWTTTDGWTWERATVEVPADADPEYQNPGVINDITPEGSGYVAVGFYYRLGIGHTGLIWTSVDGRSWSLVPHQPDLEQAIIGTVLPWRGDLLAFGHWSAGPSGGATPASAWASDDGRTWTRFELDLPDGLTMDGVVADGDRLWAAPDEIGDDTGREWTETLLTSSDGRTWTLSDLPHQTGSLTVASGALVSLVRPWPADSDTAIPPEARIPGVYRSTDGTTWQALSSEPAGVGYDLVEVGPVLIMVGDDAAGDAECWADCRALGWRSTDGGAIWQPVLADVVGGTMTSVAAMPDGTLVSVGRLLDEQGWPSPAAWVSSPSAAPAASPAPSQAPSPSPSPADLGTDLAWERAPDQATLAHAGISAVALGPDRYVAVGCSTATGLDAAECTGAAWYSTDGRTWARGTVPDADHLYLDGVVATPIGYVAWAYDMGASPGAAFWISADGERWQRAATIPSFSYDFVGGVVWFQGRLVALSTGNDPAGAEPHIWTSDDGLAWSDQTDAIGCDNGQQPYKASGTPGSNVVVSGDELVSVGETYLPADENEYRGAVDYRRVISRSVDGICWTVTSGASGGWTFDVSVTASGLVGVGTEHDPPGSGAGSPRPPIAAWTSDGPTSWVDATFTDGAPRGDLSLVAAGDQGILAIGALEDDGLAGWRSVDGSSWSRASTPDFGTDYLSDLIAVPGGFLAAGRQTGPDGETGVIWLAR